MIATAEADPVLAVRGLTVAFRRRGVLVPVIDGIDLDLRRGQVLGLVGESGSGKSMTATAVTGLLPADAVVTGSVRLAGEELIGAGDRRLSRLRGRRIGMVFQDPLAALNPVHPVGRQVAEAVRLHQDVGRAAARVRAVELLRLVRLPAPEQRARAYPHELSGGMRQRVAIAVALANDPEVLIADEPTSALDVTVQAQVLDVLDRVRRRTGTTLLLITHDLGVVARTCDEVAVLHRGVLVEQGPVERLLVSPESEHLRRLVAATSGASLRGAARRGRPDTSPAADESPVLRVDDLHLSYPVGGGLLRRSRGQVRAVAGVSLHLPRGQALALVGESGSGKTSLLTAVLALRPPERGRVEVLGRDVATLDAPARRALRRQVQVVFQDPSSSLDPRMRVADLVAEPLAVHGVRVAERRERVRELLGLVGLAADLAERHPARLSGGQRQRVAIARALALRPLLVLLDEPVSALDASLRGEIMALLDDLRGRLGLSYLLVSHDLALVRHCVDRVAVLHLGRVVDTGPVSAVLDDPRHPYTAALVSATPGCDPRRERGRTVIALRGEPADAAAAEGAGCRFLPRCPLHPRLGAEQQARCAASDPALRPVGPAPEHLTACHFSWPAPNWNR